MSDEKAGTISLRGNDPRRTFSYLLLALFAGAYEAVLLFTPLLHPYRFPTPYAVPIFDTPFALVGLGVAYLCLERHRVRQDLHSVFLGITLWLTGLLAIAHILAQPDYPGTPGVNAGVAPYFFFLSYFLGLAGVGLARHYGNRPFRLSDRARLWIGVGGFCAAGLIVVAVFQIRPLLPSLVMKPGRLTPFAIWTAGIANGFVGAWALLGKRKKGYGKEEDWFSGFLFLAASIWLLGLAGFLTNPFRYGVTWYLAGLARPIGVGVIFVGLVREQVWLYRSARARQRDLEVLHTAGQALVTNLDEAKTFETIAGKALQVSGADAAILFRLDPQAQILRPVSQAGRITPDFLEGYDPPLGTGLAGLATSERRLVWTSNLQSDDRIPLPPPIRQRVRQEGLKAGLAVPVLRQSGEVFGAFSIYYRQEREFADTDVELLSAYGTQATVAIENARLYADLQANLRRLQEAQAQLIQADKLTALGTLLSGMAHELNSPLSTILLSVDLMKMTPHPLPDPVPKRLDVITKECERASRIVKDLLLFARRKSPDRRRIDLNEVVRAAVALLTPDFALKNIRVVSDLEPTLPEIMADPHQFQQVLLNLFTNAAHAMRSAHGRGTLTVRSSRNGSAVYVEVEDDGPGIPPEHLSRIFDPFFTTKAAGEGTGLGLSVSLGIVESHGGQMRVENRQGSGARFTLSLPMAEAMEPGRASSAPPAESPTAGRRGRILVVDDEERLLATLTEGLGALGHQVEGVATGQQAIASLEREAYDVVALDLRLPDIDGKEVWRWIRSGHPALASRVVFMTGDTMSPETEKFLDEAGRPVLTKPLSLERVDRAVAEVLTA